MMWQGTIEFTRDSYYNFGDLNRENNNIRYLASQLSGLGFNAELPKPTLIGYSKHLFPRVSDINNIRINVQYLINVVGLNIEIHPNDSRVQYCSYIEINEIETGLHRVNLAVMNIKESFKYSGTFSAGEEIVL